MLLFLQKKNEMNYENKSIGEEERNISFSFHVKRLLMTNKPVWRMKTRTKFG